MPTKQIPNIPRTCLHVNIRPQFKKQQNRVMNIQLSNMREIFLTFTIHSFDLATCMLYPPNAYTMPWIRTDKIHTLIDHVPPLLLPTSYMST